MHLCLQYFTWPPRPSSVVPPGLQVRSYASSGRERPQSCTRAYIHHALGLLNGASWTDILSADGPPLETSICSIPHQNKIYNTCPVVKRDQTLPVYMIARGIGASRHYKKRSPRIATPAFLPFPDCVVGRMASHREHVDRLHIPRKKRRVLYLTRRPVSAPRRTHALRRRTFNPTNRSSSIITPE